MTGPRGLALRIAGGHIERIVDAPICDSQWLHEQVGGYFEVALTSAPATAYRRIVVWCNEDGIRLGLPLNCRRSTDGAPLVGTLIVTGALRDGENCGLTRAEEERIVLWTPMYTNIPILEIRP